MCVCVCVCVAYACIYVQDPPNAELVCKVNGVSTTTAVTLTSPVLMTDESGAMTLTYDVELLRMARGGPTMFNTSALAEAIDDEDLVCDDGIGVSLFIDDVSSSLCPPPMHYTTSPCFVASGENCAEGYFLGGPYGDPSLGYFVCQKDP